MMDVGGKHKNQMLKIGEMATNKFQCNTKMQQVEEDYFYYVPPDEQIQVYATNENEQLQNASASDESSANVSNSSSFNESFYSPNSSLSKMFAAGRARTLNSKVLCKSVGKGNNVPEEHKMQLRESRSLKKPARFNEDEFLFY